MKIKVLDIKGNNIDNVDLKLVMGGSIQSALKYIRVFLSNQRQGTSATKTRAMVRGGGKKPWKQKGSGRARAGSSRSPLWVGGGVSHGPMPKSWRLSLPRSVKLGSFAYAVSQHAKNETLMFADFSSLKKAATKPAFEFMSGASLEKEKVLIIHQSNDVLSKSFRNIKNTKILDFKSVNTFDLLNVSKVVIDKEAVESLKERLK